MLAVGGVLVASWAAFAEELATEIVPPVPSVAPPTGDEDSLFLGFAAVGASELSAARGGERTVLTLEDMMAQVDGNSISGTVNTGAATVSGESFQNFNGVSSVIINSGNNVSIQSSTTVNIVID